jgi:plastocyanin
MRLIVPLALAALAAGVVPGLPGQSLLYRSPNLGGTWVSPGGVLQFNFLHRFTIAPAGGNHKVTNFPTFTFTLGAGHGLELGTRYSTQGVVVPSRPNEFELLARKRFGAAEGEDGLALAVTPAYNTAARSVDAEASLDYSAGRITIAAAGRAMQDFLGVAGARAAVAAGLSVRLNDYVALGGDAATVLGLDSAAAWSAGISFVIPGSPHTFSLHASNAKSASIQGASFARRSPAGRVAYGFEFTIPIHFSRFAPWFGRGQRAVPVDVPMMNTVAVVAIRALTYQTDSVELAPGQAVRWVNHDFVDHTVTFEQPGPTSSESIHTNGAFVARFERSGVFRYHCTPHPGMRGVVIVK